MAAQLNEAKQRIAQLQEKKNMGNDVRQRINGSTALTMTHEPFKK